MGARCFHSQHSHFPIKKGEDNKKTFSNIKVYPQKVSELKAHVNKIVNTSYLIGHSNYSERRQET